MEKYIQTLLDEQWDALEARKKNVKVIRRNLYDAINDLAAQRSKELEAIDEQIKRDGEFVRIESISVKQRENLRNRLAIEENNERIKSIDSLGERISSIDEEIRKSQHERNELNSQRQESISTHSSRTAKYISALEDLNKSHPPENIDSINEAKKRIQFKKTQSSSVSSEIKAATAGSHLWNDVCNELDLLDGELKKCKRDQLPQIAFLVSRTADKINGYLEIASDAGWSALIIAIGHELQISHETQNAIQEIAKSSE